MEPQIGPRPRSSITRLQPDDNRFESLQFGEDTQHVISVLPENASSFNALLELPPNQAVELLHSPGLSLRTRPIVEPLHPKPYLKPDFNAPNLTFPIDGGLIERAARFSVFAGDNLNIMSNNSPETSSVPSNSSPNVEKFVKSEPTEAESLLNASQPLDSDPNGVQNQRPAKRKEREKKGKGSTKKSKASANDNCEDAEKLPYVHVRARRGQATDSHSLAERARREKINARMKLLQELVPGCNKISGTALVLDEIINHVQSLQRQVEFLSMRLAAVNPRIDVNIDTLLAAENGSLMDGNVQHHYQQQWPSDVLHLPLWGREEDPYSFITPENSASLHSNQLKMEM